MKGTHDYNKLIFANTVNELMIAAPVANYVRSLNAVTPRKIWIAHEGDIILTPRKIDKLFKEYACSILQCQAHKITTIDIAGEDTELLAHRLTKVEEIKLIKDLINSKPDIKMLCFAYDKPTINLAKSLGITIAGYNPYPDDNVIDMIYKINTKSGFREIASHLDLPTLPGQYCYEAEDLISTVDKFLSMYHKIIIKFDRSSNGYGHIIIDAKDMCNVDLHTYIKNKLSLYKGQEQGFLVEVYRDFIACPSVEIVVTDEEVSLLYLCDQRCPNAAFSGMISPIKHLEPKVQDELLTIGYIFGQYVQQQGFRGVCDVDSGLTTDNKLFVTESNFRRTGGTYLDYLVRRLVGAVNYSSTYWANDAVLRTDKTSFEKAIELLARKGINFNDTRQSGVILVANTLDIDNKWRYLVVAKDMEELNQLEKELKILLNII